MFEGFWRGESLRRCAPGKNMAVAGSNGLTEGMEQRAVQAVEAPHESPYISAPLPTSRYFSQFVLTGR